jgi:16S rRNA (guanine527-N7)-methyltransferase
MAAGNRSRVASAAADELARGALELGIRLSIEQRAIFDIYLETLIFWASRLSLTGARTAGEIVRRHILDSLSVTRYVQPGFKLADLGSGAGFPGVPLAVACPHATVVLIESRRKRANFLREAVRRCGLSNVDVLEERAEEVAARRPGSFDLVVSRAVWPVADFLRLCRVLLRPAGLAVAMKGPKAHGEIAGGPGFSAPQIIPYRLPGGIARVLVVQAKR